MKISMAGIMMVHGIIREITVLYGMRVIKPFR